MLKKNLIPILECDDTYEALIHAPNLLEKIEIPKHCVIVFFRDVIEKWLETGKLKEVFEIKSEAGIHKIYVADYNNHQICLFHPMLGGPFAAGFLEEVTALGCTKYIACGGAGVLDATIEVGHLIIPTKALRAEGTSYHYLPPSRYVNINEVAVNAIKTTLFEENISYRTGITWTTDAFYRETPEMISYRKEEGCLCVEMECASFAAVAEFRKTVFGQILYGGDDISSTSWDSRKWKSRFEIREYLVELAIKACLKL
jgi:uridine phosphorylase